jgi:3-oxoacyl-[acyl-carrier-protein] synthase-3
MTDSATIHAVVTGTGSQVPSKILSNKDLMALVDTSEEWILQRTGIRERRMTTPDETTSTLAIAAAKKALCQADISPEELDLVVVATVTGDYPWPSTSCLVQDAIGAHHAGAYDVGAACAGFIYALANVSALIRAGDVRKALVIGGDCLTKLVDWTERSTCILFGDAAAACIVEAKTDTERGVIATVLRSAGSGGHHIVMHGGGSKHPYTDPNSAEVRHTIYMDGAEVYRFAIVAMGDACEAVLAKAGLTSSQVDLFVPHQANLRIIEAAAKRLKLPADRVFINVDRYGNTSGGSIPLALDEASREGRLQPGMIALTVGFGAGLVWGANLIRW